MDRWRICRSDTPPPMPPATIKIKLSQEKGGTLPVISVEARLVIWLMRITYKLFCAAVLVSMEKKK